MTCKKKSNYLLKHKSGDHIFCLLILLIFVLSVLLRNLGEIQNMFSELVLPVYFFRDNKETECRQKESYFKD